MCTCNVIGRRGGGVRDRHRVHLQCHLFFFFFFSYHLACLWRGRMIHTNTAQCDSTRLPWHGRSGILLYMSLHWRPWTSRRLNRVRCDLVCRVWQPRGRMSKLLCKTTTYYQGIDRFETLLAATATSATSAARCGAFSCPRPQSLKTPLRPDAIA